MTDLYFHKGGELIGVGLRDSKNFRACGAREPQNSDYLSYYVIFGIRLLL